MSPPAVQNLLPLSSSTHRRIRHVSTPESLRVISLFTGAGGLDLGLEMAGYKTCACVEIVPVFRATLLRNRPDWNPMEDFGGDITKISADLLLERAGLTKGEVDVIVGGPPCQSFSNMGKRKGVKDSRGKLYLDYIKIIKDILPLG
ncbi:DNA cytosine methyltransferase, partial [Candidatus Peregrinibacteria bacterium]|nr:DNA cytosine methyltransferase [Candidatus Peregrinibacteria bacterium]